jgi:hypothetical protein
MSRDRATLARCITLDTAQIRCTPKKCILSPFEILYGELPPLIPEQVGNLQEHRQIGLHKFLVGLVHASREIAQHLGHLELTPGTLRPLHPCKGVESGGLGLGQNPN